MAHLQHVTTQCGIVLLDRNGGLSLAKASSGVIAAKGFSSDQSQSVQPAFVLAQHQDPGKLVANRLHADSIIADINCRAMSGVECFKNGNGGSAGQRPNDSQVVSR